MSALRFRGDSKSVPTTPQGVAKQRATFSPRIVFHDTWPSQEYDRRGEIATCNRLTPMLAQQIKEELNTFKMVGSMLVLHDVDVTDFVTGNGGTRELQGLHAFLLMNRRHGPIPGPTTSTTSSLRKASSSKFAMHKHRLQRRSFRSHYTVYWSYFTYERFGPIHYSFR
jgi:hypothetical protein